MFKAKEARRLPFHEAQNEALKIKELAFQFVRSAIKELRKEYEDKDFLEARREHRKNTGQNLTEEEWWEKMVAKHLPGVDKRLLIANKELIDQTRIEFINWEMGIASTTSQRQIESLVAVVPGTRDDKFLSSHFYQKASEELEKSLLDKVFSKLGNYIKNKKRSA